MTQPETAGSLNLQNKSVGISNSTAQQIQMIHTLGSAIVTTTRIFLGIGNANLNLHLSLLLGQGHTQYMLTSLNLHTSNEKNLVVDGF